MQPRAPVSFLSFLGPEGRPQNGVFFSTLSTKSQTFYTINCFSDSPEGFALLLGPVRSLAQTDSADKNTFLSLWECPKMGFFP